MEIESIIKEAAREGARQALCLPEMENIVFARFEEKLIDLDATAQILGVHPNTIRNYAKFGQIKPEPREAEQGHYKFNLGYVLKLRKSDLK